MAIMEWVHIASHGYIIGNPSEAQLVYYEFQFIHKINSIFGCVPTTSSCIVAHKHFFSCLRSCRSGSVVGGDTSPGLVQLYRSFTVCLFILDPVGPMIQQNVHEKYIFDTSNGFVKVSSHDYTAMRGTPSKSNSRPARSSVDEGRRITA